MSSRIPTIEAHLAHVAANGYCASEMKTVEVPLVDIDTIPGPDPIVPKASLQIEICDECRYVTTTCLHESCTWLHADGTPLKTLHGQITGKESCGLDEAEDDSDTSLICDFCGLDCT